MSRIERTFWDDIRESKVVQGFLAEGREEGWVLGRAFTIYEMVRLAAFIHFPSVPIGPELERITNLEELQELCVKMYQLPDAESLRARLANLLPPDHPVNGATKKPS